MNAKNTMVQKYGQRMQVGGLLMLSFAMACMLLSSDPGSWKPIGMVGTAIFWGGKIPGTNGWHRFVMTMVLFGITMNFIAFAANEFYMPVSGREFFGTIHRPLTEECNLWILCDVIWSTASIGDVVILTALLCYIVWGFETNLDNGLGDEND